MSIQILIKTSPNIQTTMPMISLTETFLLIQKNNQSLLVLVSPDFSSFNHRIPHQME